MNWIKRLFCKHNDIHYFFKDCSFMVNKPAVSIFYCYDCKSYIIEEAK